MSNNLNTVKKIGTGVRLTETAVPEILATLPEGFDPKVRGAVTDAVHNWAVGEGNERPAVKVGPKGEQRPTDYGRGIDTLTAAVKRALADSDEEKPVVLRASLSGEGGGSTTIPEDHPLYAALVEMIRGEQDSAASDDTEMAA